jgi:3-keto-5-aminohexanoate cleavage enzyme
MPYDGYSDYFEKPVIISVATTGMGHGKEANPNLPEQPEEVVEDVVACREAGASIVHLHARDEEGEPTMDPARYQELRDVIHEHVDDVVVNFTTGGRDITEDRVRPLLETTPHPDIGTIDLGPMNLGEDVTVCNTRGQNADFARKFQERGIKPELELFNNGQIPEMEYLIEQDLLEEPYWATVVMGMQTGTPPTPRQLMATVDALPEGTEWQCLALGKHQLPLTTMALILGGHVRVGMEDNIYYREGELAESNAQLVERAARIADELERDVATPDEARDILGI